MARNGGAGDAYPRSYLYGGGRGERTVWDRLISEGLPRPVS